MNIEPDNDNTLLGCFGLMLIIGLICLAFGGWMLYEIVTWITSK